MTSVIKIFMKKPAEMHPGLCKLLRCILLNENEDIDVLDRAGYYYNTLKENVQSFQTILTDVRSTESKMSKEETKKMVKNKSNKIQTKISLE